MLLDPEICPHLPGYSCSACDPHQFGRSVAEYWSPPAPNLDWFGDNPTPEERAVIAEASNRPTPSAEERAE